MKAHHETLDCYTLALDVARWLRAQRFPRGSAHLRDQAIRASESMVLNIAEGAYQSEKSRLHHYRLAKGSSGECLAILDLLDPPGAHERKVQLRRVIAMLSKMR